MPFEVYSIEGSKRPIGVHNKHLIRTEEEVADEIKKRYEEIAKKGGRIVAGHTLAATGRDEVVPILYLVADMPDAEEPFIR